MTGRVQKLLPLKGYSGQTLTSPKLIQGMSVNANAFVSHTILPSATSIALTPQVQMLV